MNDRNHKGFTLVELMVVMIVGILMLLAASAVTDVGKQSHQKLSEESNIYNSISYGFKLIQNRVHEGGALTIETPASPWIGQRLIVEKPGFIPDEAFGVYNQAGPMKDFVYLPDKDNVASRQSIISVNDTDTLTSTYSITGGKVTITVTGTKGDIPFNMSTTALKRL